MGRVSRRDLIKSTVAIAITGSLIDRKLPNRTGKLADKGWVWEGQAINRFVMPSIFGLGEGAKYFGLNKIVYMFQPNTRLAMEKLRSFDQVVCDISKWKFRGQADNSVLKYHDGQISTKLEEARTVGQLSQQFPNVIGAFDDDLLGAIKQEHTTPEQYEQVYRELKRSNPKLKLWSVVYSHELDPQNWIGFTPYMDVISFWVWDVKDLANLDRYIDQCRTNFPNKLLNLGCYLRNYPTQSPMPMDMLKFQWERVLKYLDAGAIDGYSIIASVLI